MLTVGIASQIHVNTCLQSQSRRIFISETTDNGGYSLYTPQSEKKAETP